MSASGEAQRHSSLGIRTMVEDPGMLMIESLGLGIVLAILVSTVLRRRSLRGGCCKKKKPSQRHRVSRLRLRETLAMGAHGRSRIAIVLQRITPRCSPIVRRSSATCASLFRRLLYTIRP